MWHGSRTLLTAVEIPLSGYGHQQRRTPTKAAMQGEGRFGLLLLGKPRETRQLTSRVDGKYGERTATVSTIEASSCLLIDVPRN